MNPHRIFPTSGFYLSAAHKSSGKTVIASGICAALTDKGRSVYPFKKGPDYIDPLWLSRAANNACLNLDFHTQSASRIKQTFNNPSGIKIIEGNKGLHDGVSVDGSDSNAELAALLNIPVVLVLDTQGTTRGVAPLILGYQQFDPRISIKGIILNKVAGSRHEQKLRSNIEAHTDQNVLGVIPRDESLAIDERHLGLMPSNEIQDADVTIGQLKRIMEQCVDLQKLPGLDSAETLVNPAISAGYPTPDIRIGVARDRAFGFYYADDLDCLRQYGAEICFFDTLADHGIPDGLDGLFIGGGFPEVHMQALQQNTTMLDSIRRFVSCGGPVYAECGGLMYLGKSIRWKGNTANMVGALPVETEMQQKPVGRGYVELLETGNAPWGKISNLSGKIKAHEFHYSKVRLLDDSLKFAYQVTRGWGIDGERDGLVFGNVLASYSHLRSIDPVNWVKSFTEFVRNHKRNSYMKVANGVE